MARLRKITPKQFRLPAEELAELLIGAVLIRRVGTRQFRARLVETEAYVGPVDLACHSSKGRTKRTEVMFGPAGRAYVYLIYGMHDMLNIVAGPLGSGQAVLLRAAKPLDDWQVDLSGPGKLARGLQITRRHNGLDLRGEEISLWRDPEYRPKIIRTPRIGIDYAMQWKMAPLRFIDSSHDPAPKKRVSPRRSRRLI
jgi:DNA-3-methyladenine glycosylase